MSETNWTPGPWQMEPVLLGCELEQAYDVGPAGVMEDYRIAIVKAECGGDDEQVLANARLIAAAPDLYEELDQMAAVLGRIAVAASCLDWEEVASICFAELGVDFLEDGSPKAKTKSLAKARGES